MKFSYADTLESELSRELENGRLVRLLAKMGFINERPEYVHVKLKGTVYLKITHELVCTDLIWTQAGPKQVIDILLSYSGTTSSIRLMRTVCLW